MKITLNNSDNGSDYKKGDISKELIFISRPHEIIITASDGKEIATLTIAMMHGENKTNSGNWWLNFNPVKKTWPESADVYENK